MQKIRSLEEASGQLKLKIEGAIDKDEHDRAKYDHVAGRLNTLVVLLEADLRLGEAVETKLLSDSNEMFREGMREMQSMWREEIDRVTKETELPLKETISKLELTNREIVSEIEVIGESKNLAESRIKECETDMKHLEEQNNLLR